MSEVAKPKSNDPLYNIELPVTVVVGRVTCSLAELASWEADTIVNLGLKAEEPLELQVDGKVVATGELCEGNTGPESLAIRILDIRQDASEA